MKLSKKAGVLGRPRVSADSNYLEADKTNRRVGGSWIQITQSGQYYEHCSKSIVPRELKERQRCLPLLSFSRRDEEIYSFGRKKKDQR